MPESRREVTKPFDLLDWQHDPWKDTSPIMLLTGAAGGGKSRLAAEKINGFLWRYPNSTALMLRKVRAHMANSTLLFFRREVLGASAKQILYRPSESRFEYPNGSVLIYGGMANEDQREHIRSVGARGGVDIAWMEEATQFWEEDFNEVLARMRGTAAPWRQIILTTNPDAPGHWINIRLILGQEASVHYSRASDNKFNPADYQASLERLTGAQFERLYLGEWSQGAGRVIDTWADLFNAKSGEDNGGNVTNKAEYIPGGGEVIWAIDDGYVGRQDPMTGVFMSNSHPRAILMCQLRGNGQLAVFSEHLAVQTLIEEHLNQVESMCDVNGWPRPSYVVHDKSAQAMAGALAERNYDVTHEGVTVEESVKELREWVAPDKNGFRRLIVHPRCFHMRYQMQTYSYNDKGGIIKDYDDTIDAIRYLCWNLGYGSGGLVIDVVSYGDIQ